MKTNKDYIESVENGERRFFASEMRVEKRDDSEVGVIEGYAAKFNDITVIGGWFREEILPGSFDDVLDDDVRCLFNHDPNFVLARSNKGEGTLSLSVDDVGLKYRYETPDVTYAKDLQRNIELGNVSQSSFAFTISEANWVQEEGEVDLRQIKKFGRLYDVAPVTYPAYQNTTVAKRSHEAYLEAINGKEETADEAAAKDKRSKEDKYFEMKFNFNKNKSK